MAASGATAVFKPVIPGQAVAVLFLIENSGPMAPRWPDLRDRVLPTILVNIRLANRGVPVCSQFVIALSLYTNHVLDSGTHAGQFATS
jgi:hypothetical protein